MAQKKQKKQKVSPHPYPISEGTRAKITAVEGLKEQMKEMETKTKHLNCVKKGGKWVKGKCIGKK